MPIFPPVHFAHESGIIAKTDFIDADLVRAAYLEGIFPWPSNGNLFWFAPKERGVLFYRDLYIPRKLKKEINKKKYNIRWNHNFSSVIGHCQKIHKAKEGTWITPEIIKAYTDLFKKKEAYCVSIYEEEQIIGGLYGVCIDQKIFSGESMFHLKTNASKIALVFLMEKLNECGIDWIDTQMTTPVVESLGGKLIQREEFMELLKIQIEKNTPSNFSRLFL